MINSSAAFQAAVAQDSRLFSARLLYNNTEVYGDIRKITIVKGSCGASDFVPGTVFCPYIEVIMDNCTLALEGKELELLIGLDIGGSVEEIRLGYFTVGKPSTSAYRTTFVAQGRIASMSGSFGTVPATLTIGNVAAQITADTGITVSFDAGIDASTLITGVFASNVTFPGITDRQALEVIAAVVGGYATETADGTVCVKRFDDTVTASYSAETMLELPEFHDYDTEITGVKVIVSQAEDGSETAYSSGSPVNLELNCAYMTQDAFADFAAGLIGLEWRGGRAPISLGDPRLEPWDVLQVTDTESNTFVLPCMQVTHIFDGGLQTIVDAPTIVPAQEAEGSVIGTARAAMTLADNARKVASNYLSADSTGIMVADMTDGTVETPSQATGRNVFITAGYEDSGGMEHPAGTYVRDGQETLARFGEETQIGEDGKSHLEMDFHSLKLIDKNEYTYFYVSDLRDAEGYADVNEGFAGDGSTKRFILQFPPSSVTSVTVDGVSAPYTLQAGTNIVLSTAPSAGSIVEIDYQSGSALMKAYTIGIRAASSKVGAMSYAEGYINGAEGAYSHAEGSSSHAKGTAAHAEGNGTLASGYCAHSQNEDTTASGRASHAEGYQTTASAPYSHAEGYQTTASGSTGMKYPSHAEGQETTASGYGSHAEGYKTTSSGPLSHAQNDQTVASGADSHAQNTGTVAASNSQTALGKFNVQDSNNQYAVIVGNGTSDSSRSNALTLKWNGDLKSAGEIEDGNGTSISDLLANFTDFFKVKEYPYAYSNLNPGAGLNISATDFGFSRPTGYVPIAFLRTNSGSVNVSVIGANVQATGSGAAMSIYNHSNAARSYTATITVLYARSSMVSTS